VAITERLDSRFRGKDGRAESTSRRRAGVNDLKGKDEQ
jgi:hypothetical protein